ncbi:hypothetical protein EYF80_033126 [Liparis tanakae]|uniref:Uncharacterized protein n=1 Tax=Liparis tanakae TaxID=230148 RepID=A0A4Z2GT71_9TELE|nr:hypothetical protein EYF80_033126 [Liparis tanakae]
MQRNNISWFEPRRGTESCDCYQDIWNQENLKGNQENLKENQENLKENQENLKGNQENLKENQENIKETCRDQKTVRAAPALLMGLGRRAAYLLQLAAARAHEHHRVLAVGVGRHGAHALRPVLVQRVALDDPQAPQRLVQDLAAEDASRLTEIKPSLCFSVASYAVDATQSLSIRSSASRDRVAVRDA